MLLEKSPDELTAWARDPGVPLEDKEEVLVVLEEQVPSALLTALPAFMAAAGACGEQAMRQDPKIVSYCKRLFSLLLRDSQRFLGALPEETRMALRAVARSLIKATFPKPALVAAAILGEVGHPEDSAFLEAHRPDDPTLAEVFHDAARRLRNLH